MSGNGVDIVTPVGRIVWGNPLRSQPVRDNAGKPRLDPETGNQLEQWAFGLAIPKDQCGQIFEAMNAQAAAIYPDGKYPPSFAWKFVDGDGIDNNGKSYAEREGYAGCYVFSASTQYAAPGVYQRNSQGQFVQLSEGVKTGDYARASLNIRAHGQKPGVAGAKPGLYVNPNMVELIGYGEEIRNGPSPDQAFGGAAPALPPGASATPTASGPMPGAPAAPQAPNAAPQAPAAPAAPQPPAAPQAAPTAPQAPAMPPAAPPANQAPPAAPAAAPGAPVTPPGGGAPAPNYDFLKGPGQQG